MKLLALLLVAAPAFADPKPTTAAEAQAACATTAHYDPKQPDAIAFVVKNTAKREVKTCWLELYVYDKAGAQLAHEALPYGYKIAPGQTDGQSYKWPDLVAQIAGRTVDVVQVVTSHAQFSDGAAWDERDKVEKQRKRAR